MKKILYFTVLLLVFANCSKDGKQEEKKVPNAENKICQTPPPRFVLLVNKNSDLYKEFINEKGEIDKENIFLYKLSNTEKKEYKTDIYYSNIPNRNVYLHITTQLWFENDVYTGKTETLYLQNATKTYKIEVNGYMKDTECGEVATTNEMRVNGEKTKVPYLAK